MQCGMVSRKPAYPESEAGAISCETFAAMYQFPYDIIPGLAIPTHGDIQAKVKDQRDALEKAVEILMHREGWAQRLLDVWNCIDKEDWQKVYRQECLINPFPS